MNLEIKKQLNDSKGDALKTLKKKVMAVRGEGSTINLGLSSLATENTEIELRPEDEKENKLLSYYKKVKMMRSLSQLKEMCMKEKFEKQLENVNDNMIKNDTLWKKLADLKGKHESLNTEIEISLKRLASLQVQHSVLSRDWKKSKIDYENIVQRNNEKQKKVENLEEKFNKLKKRKTIDKSKGRNSEETNTEGKSSEKKRYSNFNSDIKGSQPEQDEVKKEEDEYVSEDDEQFKQDDENIEPLPERSRTHKDSRWGSRPQSASGQIEKRNLKVAFGD
jgi:hypothetical protein